MKAEMLLDAVGAIDEEDIRAAGEYRHRPARRRARWSVAAACFVLCLALCGTADALGLISFDWVERIFGAGEQNATLQGHVISVDASEASDDITLSINSIVSDGMSIYVDFIIDTLSYEEVRNDLNFRFYLPATYSYSHGGATITQIERAGSDTQGDAREYVLCDTILGLKESLLGKTITLVVERNVTHENCENGKIETELANEWAFEIELNDALEAVGYTMEDGTPVKVTPIAVYLERRYYFFVRPKADFKIEMADGNLIDLTAWSNHKSDYVNDQGDQVRYEVSSIMLTEIIDPKDVAALWSNDSRYELTATDHMN
ncbi:MAG: hypothetical protein LLF87_04810 [Eubacteriales bacterium]|nr:hypothetical protein [Eubacteriales bacterium]